MAESNQDKISSIEERVTVLEQESKWIHSEIISEKSTRAREVVRQQIREDKIDTRLRRIEWMVAIGVGMILMAEFLLKK